jgi:hypothetical protein
MAGKDDPLKLTPEAEERLINIKQSLDDLEYELGRASEAGFDIKDRVKDLADLRAKRLKTLRVYGSNKDIVE